jgi:voltage-dependent anion channel protein 2
MLAIYKDLDKRASDLLTKDFSTDRKLEVKQKASNGVTFTTEYKLAGDKLAASYAAKFAVLDKITVDKLQLTSGSKLVLESALAGVVPNTKFTLKCVAALFHPTLLSSHSLLPLFTRSATTSTGSDHSAKVGVQYATSTLSATADFEAVQGDFTSSLALAFKPVTIGATLTASSLLKAAEDRSVDYGALVSYSADNFTATLRGDSKFTQFSAGVLHDYSSTVALAAKVSYSASKKETGVVLGGSFKLDDSSSLKLKVGQCGQVSAYYSQTLRPYLKVGVSAAVNAAKLEGDSHTFGVTVQAGDV